MASVVRMRVVPALVVVVSGCASLTQRAAEQETCDGPRRVHVSNPTPVPLELLEGRNRNLIGVIQPGSSMTLIDEGGHSYYVYPESPRRSLTRPVAEWVYDRRRVQSLIRYSCVN